MRRLLVIIIIVIAMTLSVFLIKHLVSKPNHLTTAVAVETTHPLKRDEPLFFDVAGSIEASRSVTIRSKVTGLIKQIAFQQGQMVKAGQLLFQIDPASFIADLQQAKAELLKDQAQSATLNADKARYLDLYNKGFSSKQRYDQAVADYHSNLAQIKADKAIINQKQIALDDTQIKTPISGKTGNVIVKTGDLVNANDTTLVVVNQLSPIYVNFHLTPQQLNKLMPFYRPNQTIADIYSEDGTRQLEQGALTFINNTINSQTGTVLLKATVANRQRILWPGQSVRVKLIITIEQGNLVVPARAIRTDQQGDFVYLIKQGKARVHRVTVDRQINHWAIISKGLSTDDTIAMIFPPNLKDGAQVTIVNTHVKQAD